MLSSFFRWSCFPRRRRRRPFHRRLRWFRVDGSTPSVAVYVVEKFSIPLRFFCSTRRAKLFLAASLVRVEDFQLSRGSCFLSCRFGRLLRTVNITRNGTPPITVREEGRHVDAPTSTISLYCCCCCARSCGRGLQVQVVRGRVDCTTSCAIARHGSARL